MTYEELIEPTDVDPFDPGVVEFTRKQVNDAHALKSRIEAMVDDHATAHEGDPRGRFDFVALTVRVRVPWRFTAYKIELDQDAIRRYDPDPVPDATAGWVDGPFDEGYVTTDVTHHIEHTERMLSEIDDPMDLLADHSKGSIVDMIYTSLQRGEARKPILVEIVETRLPDVEIVEAVEEEVFVPRQIGTIHFKVDAIVPPDEFTHDDPDP